MDEATRLAPRREPRILRWISALELAIGCLALAVIFVLVLVQAAQRYLPVGGWPWTGELARYSLAWLTFIMLGYLAGQGQHIAVEAIDTLRWKGVVRAVRIFAHVVVAAIALGFAAACFDLVANDTGQVSPALEMPMVWLYVIPLVGFAFTAMKSIALIFLPEPAERDETPTEPNDPEVPR
ncbi:TRAP transporter small permease [Glycomyces harbinensis]|uniref:TRAP-type C4-dicarboxylate transport system, small permease component n=1 Tax=Glycomyces harbinensis TaxID=58114 RepID=A0A1G6XLZ7_9ACTN|nr:TRAP transporter small permease [Glycomyces harbinensis]SDD78337.1 TRAP-type C4-dicarboxylate transport system, small permease component [Glycomyces harbinensis]